MSSPNWFEAGSALRFDCLRFTPLTFNDIYEVFLQNFVVELAHDDHVIFKEDFEQLPVAAFYEDDALGFEKLGID